jgi:hypothetical protein
MTEELQPSDPGHWQKNLQGRCETRRTCWWGMQLPRPEIWINILPMDGGKEDRPYPNFGLRERGHREIRHDPLQPDECNLVAMTLGGNPRSC